MSDGADVGFGIFLKTKVGERQRAGEMTEVLANQRYNSHLVPEDGTLTCSEPGICKSFSLYPGLCCYAPCPIFLPGDPWPSVGRPRLERGKTICVK